MYLYHSDKISDSSGKISVNIIFYRDDSLGLFTIVNGVGVLHVLYIFHLDSMMACCKKKYYSSVNVIVNRCMWTTYAHHESSTDIPLPL